MIKNIFKAHKTKEDQIKKIKFVTSKDFIERIFEKIKIKKEYKDFLYNPPSLHTKFYGISNNNISSMFSYILNQGTSTEKKFLRELVIESNISNNLKEILFCFRGTPDSPSKGQRYTEGYFNYPGPGASLGYRSNQNEIKSLILEYLTKNKNNSVLLLVDKKVGKIIDTLDFKVLYEHHYLSSENE